MTFKFCPVCAAPLIDRAVNAGSRCACSAGMGSSTTTIRRRSLRRSSRRRAVVLARNKAWPRHFYGLITGFLERGESPQECAVREVKEELNLDAATPGTDWGLFLRAHESGDHRISRHGIGTIALNRELDDFKHVLPEQCRVWPGGTGLALRDWLRARGIDPETISVE